MRVIREHGGELFQRTMSSGATIRIRLRSEKNLSLGVQKVMKHQDDGCSAHYSSVARNKSHKEFRKCAGTDTEYLVRAIGSWLQLFGIFRNVRITACNLEK